MKKNVAILVGGGPAPGINGVISAATIEAINRGHMVYGVISGFERLMKGDLSCVRELTIPEVSRIHNDGGSYLLTSRANPTKNEEHVKNVVEALRRLDVGYLVTIGGDDTASSARAVAAAARGTVQVAHVPKTIDNDLPLPGTTVTFGFESAREFGTEIVETLMEDARTTSRWYLAVAMGRKAGHLALGIGMSTGATLTVIPEELGDNQITLEALGDIIVGSILKRLAHGRPCGVAVLAEGLAEKIPQNSMPALQTAERDPHGHISFRELEFGVIVRDQVKLRLKDLGISLPVVEKNVGYELRCRPPVAFDREYTRQLGYATVDYLLSGGSEAMMYRQGDQLIPLPFDKFVDQTTGRAAVRLVDIKSATYQVATKYMIRITREDLSDEVTLGRLAERTNKSPEEIKKIFWPVAATSTGYSVALRGE